MVASAGTVATSNARRVLDYGLQRGLDVGVAKLGASPRIPLREMFDIWARLARKLDAPDVPIAIADGFALEQLDLLGFVVLTAPSLRESLESFARYSPLLNDGRRWEIVRAPKRIGLRLVDARPRELGVRLSHETTLAQLVHAIRRLGPDTLDPLSVGFAHAPPSDLRAHRALFRCALTFDQSADEVVYARDPFEAAPRSANRALWQWLSAEADRALAALAPRPLWARVEDEVARVVAAGAVPEMGSIAASVGTTERTLRRQLAARQRSFRQVVDEARRERTRALLATRSMAISRIAFEVGFSDASAFTHACRRWFGKAPSALLPRSS